MSPALWKAIGGAVVVMLIALFIRGYGTHRYEAGRDAVKAEDAVATQVLLDRVAKLEAEKRDTAAAAHATYEVEHAQTVIAARQPLTASQLCLNADAGGGHVPEAGRAQPGDAASAPAAAVVLEVPQTNPVGAPDRLRLLRAFGGVADDQPAVIREYQAREAAGDRQSLVP